MKKKILLVIPNLGGGGAEKVLVDLLQLLDQEKYDITLFTLFHEGVYLNSIPASVQYHTIFKKPNKIKTAIFWRVLKYFSAKLVYRLFIHEKYDAEIAFEEGLPTLLLSGSDCKNKIAWVHCDLMNFNWVSFYYKSDKHQEDSYREYQKIVFVSEQTKNAFQQKFGSMGTETIIHNVINTRAILEKSEEFIPTTTSTMPAVCAIGRLFPVKGFMRLLSVHKRLMEEGISHQLWICGSGPEMEPMKQYIKENRLEHSVVLWGFQKNPYPFLKQAEIYVCSSISEGFSLTIAEAMVLSCPIVSTRSAGPEELLKNGNYGCLVENSEEGLYEGIRALLTDKALLKEEKQKSMLGAKQFNADRVLSQIEELL